MSKSDNKQEKTQNHDQSDSNGNPAENNKDQGATRPMNWVSIAKDGNVSNLDDSDSGWMAAGGKGPVASHGGKILPKFARKNKDNDGKSEDKDDVSTNSSAHSKSEREIEVPDSSVFIVFSSWTVQEVKDRLHHFADADDQIHPPDFVRGVVGYVVAGEFRVRHDDPLVVRRFQGRREDLDLLNDADSTRRIDEVAHFQGPKNDQHDAGCEVG